MNTDDTSQSPFTKPRFIIAAIVMAFIVIFGIAIVFINAAKDDPDLASHESVESSSTISPSAEIEPVGGASICGLKGVVLEGTLPKAPETQWAYEGTTAYPTSSEFGPGMQDEAAGFQYCFQHSPEGALFAAAYALAVGTDQSKVPAWIEYFTAPGPYRTEFLEPGNSNSSESDVRLRLAGFRLLSYTGDTARVDLAMVASTQGQSFTVSGVYDLVWSEGDWKIDTSTLEPGSFSSIPDLTGYISWGE